MPEPDRAVDRSAIPPTGLPRRLFIAVLILAAALRVIAIDKPFFVDEISTITIASQPLGRMAEAMRETDASPALYPVLLHVWIGVSTADWWVRLLSAMFGVIAVLMVGLVAGRAFGWRAGLAAAFVMAIAPAHVHYSQYVRSYSLFTLLAAVHVWLFIDWFDDEGPIAPRKAAAVVLTTASLLYTHYLSVLLFAGEAVAAMWRLRLMPRRVLLFGAAGAFGGLLFLPGVPLLLHNAAFDRLRNVDRPSRPPLVRVVPDLALELVMGQRPLGFSDPGTRRVALSAAAVVFPAIWLFGAIKGWQRRRFAVVALCAVSLLPLALYLVSGRKMVAVRFFVPFATGWIVLLAYGLSSLEGWRRVAAVMALSALSAIPLWHYYRTFTWSYDHRLVARAILDRSQPGDVILVTHPYEAFYYRWYLGSRLQVRGLTFTPIDEQDSYVIKPGPVRFDHARARVLAMAADHPRMWVVGQSPRSFASDEQEQARVLEWMDQTYRRAVDLDAVIGPDPIVRLYERAPGGPESGR
jgi:mannosyltransferase